MLFQLKDLLKHRAFHSPIGIEAQAALVLRQWEEIVVKVLGEQVRGQTKAQSFKDGILRVRCQSPAWRQEVSLVLDECLTVLVKKEKKIKKIVLS